MTHDTQLGVSTDSCIWGCNKVQPTLVQEEQLRTWLVRSSMTFLSSTPRPFLNRAGSVLPSYLGPLSPLFSSHSYQADTPLHMHRCHVVQIRL